MFFIKTETVLDSYSCAACAVRVQLNYSISAALCQIFIMKQRRKPVTQKGAARFAQLPQTVEQSKSFRQFDESFRPPFSKGGAVEGAEPSSPPAGGEIPLRRFLFAKLFLCAYIVKEKAEWGFMHIDGQCAFCQQPVARLCLTLKEERS